MSPRTRAFLQLLLAVPGSFIGAAAFVIDVLVGGISHGSPSRAQCEPPGVAASLWDVLGPGIVIGFVSLWWSIITLPTSSAGRALLAMGLLTGLVCCVCLFAWQLAAASSVLQLFTPAAILASPVAVAVWNFIRLFKPPVLTKR